VRAECKGVTHLLYREGEMTLRADKINERIPSTRRQE